MLLTWQVVFISTVIGRNKRLNSEIGRAHNAGLMADGKRFNVAITRAKALLVVCTRGECTATWLGLQHCCHDLNGPQTGWHRLGQDIWWPVSISR